MSATYVDEFTESFTLNPTTTALVVIDMQNATGNPNHGLGKLLDSQGRLDSASYRFERIKNTIVPNTQRLLQHFRAIGAPVIYVTYGAELPDCSDVPKHIRKLVIATNNKAGEIEQSQVAQAIKDLDVNPEKIDPYFA